MKKGGMAGKEQGVKTEKKARGLKPLTDNGITVHSKTLKRWYQLIHLGRQIDTRAATYVRQGKGWSYQSSCAGHEGIQLILGLSFRPGKDFLYSYYRDLLTCLAAGMTIDELMRNGLSRASDPGSGGRHMSNHFSKPSIRIQNVSSATGEPRAPRGGNGPRHPAVQGGRDRLRELRGLRGIGGIRL